MERLDSSISPRYVFLLSSASRLMIIRLLQAAPQKCIDHVAPYCYGLLPDRVMIVSSKRKTVVVEIRSTRFLIPYAGTSVVIEIPVRTKRRDDYRYIE